jgi:predicted phage terminase large subunit-like protein
MRAKRSLERYIDYVGLGFKPAAHHRLLLSELEAVERGDTPKLMVCMPPGSGKSYYSSAVFPSWFLGRNPEKSVIAGSHTYDLAERFGRRVRNLYASPAHRGVFKVGVAEDNKAAGSWSTEKGGEYFAIGVGGAVAGRRADLGLIDDPVKNREDADSERSRDRVWDWYVNDFVPRLKPGAAQIVVMTRWHEDDLGGRILEREAKEWRLIELPMEAYPDDILGRKAGERLWPDWFTAEQVETAKLDTRSWNALYQQRPATEEGDYFKAAWFATWAALPDNLIRYGASDYAVTEGGGDYTEHGIFGVDPWSNIYVLDWWREQAPSNVWIEAQCDLILRHQPGCWFGEAGAIKRAIEPYLLKRMAERRAFCRVEWLPSMADKTVRARSFQALASMGKVFMPQNARWKAELVGQLTRFPAGKYDDGVDVCSLIGRGARMMRAPKIQALPPPKPRFVPIERGRVGTGWMGR